MNTVIIMFARKTNNGIKMTNINSSAILLPNFVIFLPNDLNFFVIPFLNLFALNPSFLL